MNSLTARFVLGVLIGILFGAAAVVLIGRRAGSTSGAGIGKLFGNAVDVGRQAAQDREQELREEYFRRVERQKAEIFKGPPAYGSEFQRRPEWR
jgi:hypothetical protein